MIPSIIPKPIGPPVDGPSPDPRIYRSAAWMRAETYHEYETAPETVIIEHPPQNKLEGSAEECIEDSASGLSRILQKACDWFGCRTSGCLQKQQNDQEANDIGEANLSDLWDDVKGPPEDWQWTQSREIPKYVLEHAPLIHLYSGEEYWPCDMTEHLIHTTPHLNYTALQSQDDHPDLGNLGGYNRLGRFVYLQSDDNVEDRPDWLGGETNIPVDPSEDGGAYRDELRRYKMRGQRIDGGRSDAPAVLLVVPKPHGVVDAFWFFFYSYNLGNAVFNIRFGNHVGDWEHTAVRFKHGEPKAVFFSEHSFGSAYSWKAVEKSGSRPVGFSATGTHAMYGTPGTHPYVLPWGILHDMTDRGPLWDPAQNMYSYTYNFGNNTLLASSLNPTAPTSWFDYGGRWGDKIYPMTDPRQYQAFGQYHYVSGPLGPRFKNLGRTDICQGGTECIIRDHLDTKGGEVRMWEGGGQGEEMSDDDARSIWGDGLDYVSRDGEKYSVPNKESDEGK